MKVKRTVTVNVDSFKVGDTIEIDLTDGVKAEAMAMKQEEDGMIFCLVDCLPNEYPMNNTRTNEGGYEESKLRKKLNGEILNLFPTELKATMVPLDNGDLIRLPTEREIFGKNQYGGDESQDVKQWEPMKKRRNRMAFDGSKDEYRQCYWLANRGRKSATCFSNVTGGGRVSNAYVSYSCGVRPAFKIKNGETKPGKPKQERMVTRTVSYAKGEEVVYYNILYGFGRQDVLEKLYHYEQEEEEANEWSIRGNRESCC